MYYLYNGVLIIVYHEVVAAQQKNRRGSGQESGGDGGFSPFQSLCEAVKGIVALRRSVW